MAETTEDPYIFNKQRFLAAAIVGVVFGMAGSFWGTRPMFITFVIGAGIGYYWGIYDADAVPLAPLYRQSEATYKPAVKKP